MKKLVLLAVLATSFVNAQDWYGEKVKGNGKEVSEKRSTLEYDVISITGPMDMNLVAGKEGDLTLTGEENLLTYIKTELDGNTLKIFVEKKISLRPSNNKKLIITVPFDKISKVSLAGSGDIMGKDAITGDSFDVRLAGSGDVTLNVNTTNLETAIAGSGNITINGKATNLEAKISGSGDIKCENVISENATASISGSGDIKVNCSKKLVGRISGSGDIRYKGKPESVDKKVNGSGEISSF